MSARVLLADDHKMVRDGLRTLLEKQPDMEIVGEASDGRDTLKLIDVLSPDIVIMDIAMPNLNGIDATHQIRQDHPGVKVIALSMHSDKRFVGKMLKAGAWGYLLKDSAFEDLVVAIRAVMQNKRYLSPDIAGIVVEDFVSPSRQMDSSAYSLLSGREREVLQLMAEGKTTRQIAEKLNVSIKTVETHRMKIMDKLDIRSLAELTKYAIREGLTQL
ncbi:MAG: response regulator transcription factor [Nitrospirota bacterium]|jgi:DNA-binding NarL/FixJ family response regulator